jgi:hypothetical protein
MNRLYAAAFTAAALSMLPFTARAQNAICPNWSMGAKVHPTTETAYTIQVTDQCADLVFLNTGAEVVNLPNPGVHFPYGFMVRMQAVGAGGITLTPTSPVTVNAASTLAKAAGTAVMCYTDNVNWWC